MKGSGSPSADCSCVCPISPAGLRKDRVREGIVDMLKLFTEEQQVAVST